MFEDIRANLELLESSGIVTAENLLDSMYRLYKDAKALNGVGSVKAFKVKSTEDYGSNLVNLLAILETSYSSQEVALNAINDSDVDEVRQDTNGIMKKLAELKPVLESLRSEKEQKAKVQEEYNALQAEHTQLQQDLAAIPSYSPEEIRSRNENLKKELERKEALSSQMQTLTAQVTNTKSEADRLAEQVAEEERKREEENERITTLRARAEEFIKWEENLPETKNEVSSKAAEAQSAFLIIENAWNSLAQRKELPEIFASYVGEGLFPDEIKSFSDLQSWFSTTGEGMTKALAAYQEMYRALLSIVNKTN